MGGKTVPVRGNFINVHPGMYGGKGEGPSRGRGTSCECHGDKRKKRLTRSLGVGGRPGVEVSKRGTNWARKKKYGTCPWGGLGRGIFDKQRKKRE